MNLPIAVLGEALMDCVFQADGSLRPMPGGSPFNLARAAALQGARVHYLPPFSEDRLGRSLKARAKADGVEVGAADSTKPTSLALVSFDGEQARYAFYREEVADRDWTPEEVLGQLHTLPPGILHTGSLALVPPDGLQVLELMRSARKQGWTLSVDLNVRIRLAPDQAAYLSLVRQATAMADWVKASDDDLQALGLPVPNAGTDLLQLLRQSLAPQARRLALTQGAGGACLWMDGQAWQSPAHPVALEDTVGAGDTFWGACIADWAAGRVEGQMNLRHALQAAAINCARRGCQPPTRAETEAVLAGGPPPSHA